MIGVDTNVLARLFLEDDPKQGQAARRFFAERSSEDPAFVGAVVIVEFAWLLTSRYGYTTDAVHTALAAIFASADVVVEQEMVVKTAVNAALRDGADIADAIIAAIAQHNGAGRTVTFDRTAAKRIGTMELLA